MNNLKEPDKNKTTILTPQLISDVRDSIAIIRDIPVIADADVAALYQVETKRINEAVRNNPEKLPKITCLLYLPVRWKFCGRKFRPQKFPQKAGLCLKYLRKRDYTCWQQY